MFSGLFNNCQWLLLTGPYHYGEHNGDENRDLQRYGQVFEESSEELADTLTKVLQWLRDEGCDGYRDRLNKKRTIMKKTQTFKTDQNLKLQKTQA